MAAAGHETGTSSSQRLARPCAIRCSLEPGGGFPKAIWRESWRLGADERQRGFAPIPKSGPAAETEALAAQPKRGSGKAMMSTHRVAVSTLLAAAAWLSAATLAHAQSAAPQPTPTAEVMPVAPPPSGWRVTLTPYLWFAGVKSSLTFSPPVGSRSTIDANLDTSFSDIFHDLNAGFMGAGEVRQGKVTVQTDIIYMNVSQSGSRVTDVVIIVGHIRFGG